MKPTLQLLNVYRQSKAFAFLYEVLKSRPVESRISHQEMPSYIDHIDFVASKPYREWFLIKSDGKFVGDIHVTKLNEVGIFFLPQYRGLGLGRQAMELFMKRLKPLPPIRAKRVGQWLARVSPENEAGAEFFRKMGFKMVEHTWSKGIDGRSHV